MRIYAATKKKENFKKFLFQAEFIRRMVMEKWENVDFNELQIFKEIYILWDTLCTFTVWKYCSAQAVNTQQSKEVE